MNNHKKMFEILKDTKDWYAEDPSNRRSVDGCGSCQYTWGNNHCAVGRYLQEDYQYDAWNSNNESVNELCAQDSKDSWDIDWCLRKEVHGLDPDFWTALQFFHDSSCFWNLKEKGLTDKGKEEYSSIRDRIARGNYDESCE